MYTTGNETKTCGKGPVGKGNLFALHFDGIDKEKKNPSGKCSLQILKSWDLLFKSQRYLRNEINALHLLQHTLLQNKGCEYLYL